MDEVLVRVALKALIESNQASLVAGLTSQGQSRSIHQITYSSLTPPTQYYFVSIWTDNVVQRTRQGFGRTVALPPSEVDYHIVIEIADYAVASPGNEDEVFEKMDSDFQRFGDRLVNLLRSTATIIYDDTTYKLRDPREVTKENQSDIAVNASNFHSMVYSRITFTLTQECI